MATIINDGLVEDLIRTFQQLACTEGHLKTLIEKYQSEIQNRLIEVEDEAELKALAEKLEVEPKDVNDVLRKAHIVKLNDTIDELNDLAELRRAVMLRVMNAYPAADKNWWCTVKHLSMASYCAFEAYQASDNDAVLLNIWLATNARFVNAMTHWLGTEITSCAACFSDILKGEKGNEQAEL